MCPDPLAPENVWDYPRPPRLEPVPQEILIVFAGQVIARTSAAWRVLETTHPPTYYLPREGFTGCAIDAAPGSSLCEWKGAARYAAIRVGARRADRAAWFYPDPAEPFAPIRDHLAVYCAAMDECFVGGLGVTPQPGGFYGGWVTSNLIGPFKGGPGTMGW